MKRVLSFQSPKEHYRADACIIWCIDARFSKALEELIRTRNFHYVDLIKLPGGAKALVSPAAEEEKRVLLSYVKTSLKLHDPKIVLLMTHSDCGGYGGLKAFDSDLKKEKQKMEEELKEAKQVLLKEIPQCPEIELFFVDFQGFWQI